MIISKGNGNSKRVPCTWSTKIRRAILMGLSFFSISKSMWTQNVELASTLKIGSFPLFFYSGGWFGSIFILTPSASGLSSYLPTIFTSKEKLIFEQFLKGIFMVPLLGIFIIFVPDRLSYSSLRQMIWGTYPLLMIGSTRGFSSSIWSSREPEMSVDTYSSGMLALTNIVKGYPFFIGTSIYDSSYPFSTALTVNIFSKL